MGALPPAIRKSVPRRSAKKHMPLLHVVLHESVSHKGFSLYDKIIPRGKNCVKAAHKTISDRFCAAAMLKVPKGENAFIWKVTIDKHKMLSYNVNGLLHD